MPDIWSAALATPGLGWLLLTIAIAGLVRGFTGFGTALIFVPVAGQFLPPQQIILLVTITGIFSNAVLLPRAWRSADRAEVGLLAGVAVLTVPVGLWALRQVDPLVIRWVVAAVASVTLLAVITGWQWRGRLGRSGLGVIGGSAGFFGGMTGLTGPVVIMFYLANARSAEKVRANTILFLASLDVVIITYLLLQGQMTWLVVTVGILLAMPYMLTSLIGQRLFDPSLERMYRVVAYCVVGLAVLTGLPLFD